MGTVHYQHLRVHAKVSQRGQFCKQRLDVCLHGTLNVPVQLV